MRSHLLEDFTSKLLAGRFYKWFIQAICGTESRADGENSSLARPRVFTEMCLFQGTCKKSNYFNKSQREGKSSFDLQNLNGACPLQVVRLKCLGWCHIQEDSAPQPRITNNQHGWCEARAPALLVPKSWSNDVYVSWIPREPSCHYASHQS